MMDSWTAVLTFKSVDEILHVLYVITIQMKPLQQYMYFHIVWFQKISIPPLRKGFAVWPPSAPEFPKLAPKIYPPPFQISKIFAHPLELLLSLIEVNKLVVLFTRVPHFVSFMYFLLNSITGKRIRHALKLQCILNKFLPTRKWNARLLGKYKYTFLSRHQEESNTWRSINKEIRTSSRYKTVRVSNFVLPNLHIWWQFFFEGIAQAFQTDTKSVRTSIHSKTANCKEHFCMRYHAKGWTKYLRYVR